MYLGRECDTNISSRWVNLFNANLDASPAQRKTTKQLMLDLRRWEETEEKKKGKGKFDTKDFDPEKYQVCLLSTILASTLAQSIL